MRVFLPLVLLALSAPALAGEIRVPEGTTAIEAEAFYGCEAVDRVTVPDSVTEIGEDAFALCGEALLIQAGPGSAAAAYAAAHQLDYQADTEYRALIICQTYTGTDKYLEGTAADRDAMKACLSRLGVTPYTVEVRTDLDPAGMLEAVRECFKDADETDVSLLYYNGHGASDGSLVGADESFSRLSPAELRSALDAVPGRKVLVVDACYSGKFVPDQARNNGGAVAGRGAGSPDGADGFVSAFQSAFRFSARGADAGRYFVLTSCQGDEKSYEISIRFGSAQRTMGIFTYAFCRGCGWNGVICGACGLMADAGGDDAVSLREAFEYALRIGKSYPDIRQTADVWPEDCGWFAPFRR